MRADLLSKIVRFVVGGNYMSINVRNVYLASHARDVLYVAIIAVRCCGRLGIDVGATRLIPLRILLFLHGTTVLKLMMIH